ncbi:class I SAM-dependent methyltransferase [Salarchaeum sp. III]|uniref:class I SAM-dependent methyltransferase n=1 Tax=Salarchaeum sp. III TaxID=3107927 RepID=UPI002ED7D037
MSVSVERPLGRVYDAAYAGVPNWDIGRPQRPFVRLVESGVLDGPLLDVGCGTGELALFAARHGYDVLGIDLSELAVAQAREKARWRRVSAHFLVWDALRVSAFADTGLWFGSVLDSAMFHVLGERERDAFVRELHAVLDSGGLYCVLGDRRMDERDVYGVSVPELHERFPAERWELVYAEETAFERRWGATPAVFAVLRRR